MQFIVKPNGNYRFIYLKKWWRNANRTVHVFGDHVLLAFAFVVVFSSGLLFGLMWNFDNKCERTAPQQQQQQHQIAISEFVATGHVDKRTFVAIAVISCAQNVDRRNAIRESWILLGDRKQYKYYFVIGSSHLSDDRIRALNTEQENHNDLLLLSTVKDNYASLTHKVLNAFQWFDDNMKFDYLLKVDDDSFVRIDALLTELLERKKVRSKLYWGYFDGRASVKRRGQWKEDSWFLCDKYLPYAIGGGYLLSHDLVAFIAKNADSLQLYQSEDVSVGVWLSPLKVDRVHEPRFDTEFESRGCSNSYLITHKQTVNDMRIKYENILKLGKLCNKEFTHRNAYQYNWRAPPSQCCIRNLSAVIG